MGTTEFLGIITFIMPPYVSIPRDKDTISSSVTFSENGSSEFVIIYPCIAAPAETTSSGFRDMFNSLPPNIISILFFIWGILVIPPTSITSSMSSLFNSEDLRASSTGFIHNINKSLHSLV